jgi:general secretion pathway protein N
VRLEGERHPLERSGRPVQYASESLTQLRWDLDGWSLLRLAPEVSVRFGERSGLNGQGILGWNGAAFGRDITLNAPAPGCWSGCR